MIEPVRDRETFRALRERGIRVRQGPLGVVFLAEGSQIRLAFALTRQVGGAVVRNRIRRRLRAILADLARQDLVPPGVLLVSARTEALQRRPDELRDDVIHLLAALDARRHRTGSR